MDTQLCPDTINPETELSGLSNTTYQPNTPGPVLRVPNGTLLHAYPWLRWKGEKGLGLLLRPNRIAKLLLVHLGFRSSFCWAEICQLPPDSPDSPIYFVEMLPDS